MSFNPTVYDDYAHPSTHVSLHEALGVVSDLVSCSYLYSVHVRSHTQELEPRTQLSDMGGDSVEEINNSTYDKRRCVYERCGRSG